MVRLAPVSFAAMLGLLAAGCSADVAPPAALSTMPLPSTDKVLAVPDGYALVWNDDFADGPMPDRSRWRYETQRNRKGWYNEELQYYARGRPRNSRIEHGRLVIEAHREDLSGEGLGDWSGQRFTSARLTTRGKGAWLHGFFEVRAKVPCVRGAWPAIWLLPQHQDMRWQGGEIDIVEAVGYEPTTIHHAIQTTARNFTRGNQAEGLSTLDYCAGFHDYQLLWTKDRILMGVDGKVGFATVPYGFDRPMALILNVAVGGKWAGAQGIDEAALPARMEIEHVRVWQPKEQ